MKTILKILKWFGIIVIALIVILVTVVYSMYPKKAEAPKVSLAASNDSAVIAHGKYLVYGPAHCAECHAYTREDIANMRPINGLIPSGGMPFTLPGGVVYAKNLTPDKENGIGRYSDNELARIIRYGVKPNNEIIFPFMAYGDMSDEDLTSIISYLRSIPAVKKEIPVNDIGFMLKAIIVFFINPYPPTGEIPKFVKQDTTIEYGRYLSNAVSGCRDCHTKLDEMTGKFIGEPFAGGGRTPSATEEPGVWVITPNLTPDAETGKIYNWSFDQFKDRFHKGRMVNESIMPWEAFQNYSDEDLKAVYRFLMSLKPIRNEVGETIVREET